jgi:hypothetical protein
LAAGQQMMMMVPPGMMGGRGRGAAMMAAMTGGRGGRGRGRSNVWTPDGAGGGGGGRAPTSGPTSKTWVRPGAEMEAEGDAHAADAQVGGPAIEPTAEAKGEGARAQACRRQDVLRMCLASGRSVFCPMVQRLSWASLPPRSPLD